MGQGGGHAVGKGVGQGGGQAVGQRVGQGGGQAVGQGGGQQWGGGAWRWSLTQSRGYFLHGPVLCIYTFNSLGLLLPKIKKCGIFKKEWCCTHHTTVLYEHTKKV